mmetsp:Transcript_3104/g.12311  ORF Transcript_3104/g.12311 Transcript_3104/m.12311 type:complete len:237 (-) Transcript_3104:415-1125(-)
MRLPAVYRPLPRHELVRDDVRLGHVHDHFAVLAPERVREPRRRGSEVLEDLHRIPGVVPADEAHVEHERVRRRALVVGDGDLLALRDVPHRDEHHLAQVLLELLVFDGDRIVVGVIHGGIRRTVSVEVPAAVRILGRPRDGRVDVRVVEHVHVRHEERLRGAVGIFQLDGPGPHARQRPRPIGGEAIVGGGVLLVDAVASRDDHRNASRVPREGHRRGGHAVGHLQLRDLLARPRA